tara:strand:- start:12 stop:263 length:252 start_codon:yes stop_codon:yes gene_type:complete
MTHDYKPNKEGKLSRRGIPYPEGWENMTKSQKRAFYKMQLEWTSTPRSKEDLNEDYLYATVIGFIMIGICFIAEYMRANGITY